VANPAQTLFAAGAFPTGWTGVVSGAGSVAVEGPSGDGQAVIRAPNASSAASYLQSPAISGDFDFMVCVADGDTLGNGGEMRLSVGLILVSNLSRYYTIDWLFGVGWWSFVDGSIGGNIQNKGGVRHGAPQDSGYTRFRLRRVGSTLSSFIWSSGAWVQISNGAAWVESGPVVLRISPSYAPLGSGKVLVRGIIPLTAGADPAAPSAPTDGKAFSAPSTDDLDLGVGASWASPGADVARKYEVRVSTNSGFTAIVDRKVHDLLLEGLRASHRTGGLVAGTTYYICARWWDECGQPGTWSATVSAAAAITPSIVPVFTYPVGEFQIEELEFVI
jgi:hypothetical protein